MPLETLTAVAVSVIVGAIITKYCTIAFHLGKLATGGAAPAQIQLQHMNNPRRLPPNNQNIAHIQARRMNKVFWFFYIITALGSLGIFLAIIIRDQTTPNYNGFLPHLIINGIELSGSVILLGFTRLYTNSDGEKIGLGCVLLGFRAVGFGVSLVFKCSESTREDIADLLYCIPELIIGLIGVITLFH
ncbi:hypothetical protein M422DRAFT_275983 [Sphaerobolus stellatus SS14]|uniref:Uncharacterized protein n=1 Tax=Sphaerobolus stellatus (strain SS14) TaxID=990650 RepID=A0A0C9U304_SPHS4|nr:hypothetical protein M422DRAFT_275983 [Sphaerobolus stellatus SS14]